MAAAVVVGPVSIGVDASSFAFQHYRSGIIRKNCGTQLDHGALIVGFGSENATDYWLLKNSWSQAWGEDGYFRVIREMSKEGEPGVCGI